MTMLDPFDLLEALNPVSELTETLPTDDAMLAAIFAGEIEAAELPAAPVRSRRRTRWMLGGAGVVIAVVAAALAFGGGARPYDPIWGACYSNAADRPNHLASVGFTTDPISDCVDLWQKGAVGSGTTAPQLVACVRGELALAVVPGDIHTCERLGWQRWTGSFSDEERAYIHFADELRDAPAPCFSVGDAVPKVEELLKAYGYEAWTVERHADAPGARSCAVADPSLADRRVNVHGHGG